MGSPTSHFLCKARRIPDGADGVLSPERMSRLTDHSGASIEASPYRARASRRHPHLRGGMDLITIIENAKTAVVCDNDSVVKLAFLPET